jgi:hypothetical protein
MPDARVIPLYRPGGATTGSEPPAEPADVEEDIYPMIGNVTPVARLLGTPYFPVTPLFPLLGPLGMIPLPSKWYIEFGELIRTDGYDRGSAQDQMVVFNLTDQIRETIQQTLHRLLIKRRNPFLG